MTWQPPKHVYDLVGTGKVYTEAQLFAVRQQTIEECARLCSDAASNIWDYHDEKTKKLA